MRGVAQVRADFKDSTACVVIRPWWAPTPLSIAMLQSDVISDRGARLYYRPQKRHNALAKTDTYARIADTNEHAAYPLSNEYYHHDRHQRRPRIGHQDSG